MPSLYSIVSPHLQRVIILLLLILLVEGGGRGASAAAAEEDGQGNNNFEHQDIAQAEQQASILNIQPFTGALGGATASAIIESSDPQRQFQVEGDTFPDFSTAADRACDNQHNACADMVNSGQTTDFEVGDCDTQNDQCKSVASGTSVTTTFAAFTTTQDNFDIYCD